MFYKNASVRRIYVYEECVELYKSEWSSYKDSIYPNGENCPETTTIQYTTSDGNTITSSKLPIISNIYDNELITPIIRTMALTMLLTSVVIVQNSIVLRQMKFKKFFYITLIGQTISGVLGIVLALLGYGPWALVFQTITGAV